VQKWMNWWDMKPFPVPRLLDIVRKFQESVSDPKFNYDAPFVGDGKQESLDTIASLVEMCEECRLLSTADQFKRIWEEINVDAKVSEVNKLLPDAINRLEDECQRHVVMLIEPDYFAYFLNPQFFDPKDATALKVSAQFPSAAEDIAESGKCLACGRPTACVMHLNRVVEVGLTALAAALGSGLQNDWGKYLSEIDKELTKRIQQSGARTPDEQFYSEAQITIDSIRRAWRNPTMHIDKTYTEERAEEILVAVRSFMRHLATKLHD
jgi:hypothetical protein